jgi:hypothetical protein
LSGFAIIHYRRLVPIVVGQKFSKGEAGIGDKPVSAAPQLQKKRRIGARRHKKASFAYVLRFPV